MNETKEETVLTLNVKNQQERFKLFWRGLY